MYKYNKEHPAELRCRWVFADDPAVDAGFPEKIIPWSHWYVYSRRRDDTAVPFTEDMRARMCRRLVDNHPQLKKWSDTIRRAAVFTDDESHMAIPPTMYTSQELREQIRRLKWPSYGIKLELWHNNGCRSEEYKYCRTKTTPITQDEKSYALALIAAAARPNPTLLQALLSHPTLCPDRPEIWDELRYTPLQAAIVHGKTENVKLLAEKNLYFDRPCYLIDPVTLSDGRVIEKPRQKLLPFTKRARMYAQTHHAELKEIVEIVEKHPSLCSI